MKKLLSIAFGLLMAVSSFAATNGLTFTPSVDITAGGTATITVNMDNQPDIAGFQFDMIMPEGLSVVSNSKGKMIFDFNADRIDDHVVISNIRTNGQVAVLSYSASTEPYIGTSGKVLTFQVKADDTYKGTHNIEVVDIKMSTSLGKKVEVQTTASIVVNGPAESYSNGITFTPNVDITAGGTATITVNMDNQPDIAGFQFDMIMPEGLSVVSNSKGKMIFDLNADRIDDHVVISNIRTNGQVAVLSYSASTEPYIGTSGKILTFQVKADDTYKGTHNIEVVDIKMSTSLGKKVEVQTTASITVNGPTASYSNGITFTPNVDITAGGTATITVNMDNQPDIAGFQFDMIMPEGLSVVSNSKGKMIFDLNADRIDDHVVISNIRTNGQVAVLSYSASTEPYIGTSGKILTFQVKADDTYTGTHNIEVVDIKMSTSLGKKVEVQTTASITVNGPTSTAVKTTGITIDKLYAVMKEGESANFTAIVAPENATVAAVKWESSDPNIATVDENGKVTGVAKGVAVITASTTDGTDFKAQSVAIVDKDVKQGIKGDINEDEIIDLTDVSLLIDIILHQ